MDRQVGEGGVQRMLARGGHVAAASGVRGDVGEKAVLAGRKGCVVGGEV